MNIKASLILGLSLSFFGLSSAFALPAFAQQTTQELKEQLEELRQQLPAGEVEQGVQDLCQGRAGETVPTQVGNTTVQTQCPAESQQKTPELEGQPAINHQELIRQCNEHTLTVKGPNGDYLCPRP